MAEEAIRDPIPELQGLLDSERKAASIKKLKAALNRLTEEQRESVLGLDDLESAIEEYEGIERSGLTPEEYREEKESAWEGIETALENLELEEPEEAEEPEEPPAPRPGPPPSAPPPFVVRPVGPAGFLRPFGCGEFIRDYLVGEGPYGAPKIDPNRGAPEDDIRVAYKAALRNHYAEEMVAIALEKGKELTMEQVLPRVSTRTRGVRAHSFVRYFHNLKLLGWVKPTGQEEVSVPGGRPGARLERTGEGTALVEVPQPRRYYRLTAKGRQATAQEWADPLVALYGYTPEQRRGKAASPEA